MTKALTAQQDVALRTRYPIMAPKRFESTP